MAAVSNENGSLIEIAMKEAAIIAPQNPAPVAAQGLSASETALRGLETLATAAADRAAAARAHIPALEDGTDGAINCTNQAMQTLASARRPTHNTAACPIQVRSTPRRPTIPGSTGRWQPVSILAEPDSNTDDHSIVMNPDAGMWICKTCQAPTLGTGPASEQEQQAQLRLSDWASLFNPAGYRIEHYDLLTSLLDVESFFRLRATCSRWATSTQLAHTRRLEHLGAHESLIAHYMKGNKYTVQVLIEHKLNIDERGERGETAMMKACIKSDHSTLRKLLAKGADIEIQCDEGKTALAHAVYARNTFCANLLLNEGAEVDSLDTHMRTPLLLLCFSWHPLNYVETLRTAMLLLEFGADPTTKDVSGDSAVMAACRDTTCGVFLVHMANLQPQWLIKATNLTKETSAHEAAKFNNPAAIITLSRVGCDMEATNQSGMTPLHLACLKGHEMAVTILIKTGADVNARNNVKRTPLYYAIRSASTPIVRELLQRGAVIERTVEMLVSRFRDSLKESLMNVLVREKYCPPQMKEMLRQQLDSRHTQINVCN